MGRCVADRSQVGAGDILPLHGRGTAIRVDRQLPTVYDSESICVSKELYRCKLVASQVQAVVLPPSFVYSPPNKLLFGGGYFV